MSMLLNTFRFGAPPAQTPIYQSHSTNWDGNIVPSLTINKPSGVVAGDLMIAMLGRDIGFSAYDWAVLSGWTQVRTDRNSLSTGNGVNTSIQWKIAGGSEPASYTFSTSNSSARAYGTIIRVSGAHQTTPIPQNTFVYVSGDVTTWNHSAITAAAPNRLGISLQDVTAGGGAENVLAMTHATSGWTERLDTQPHTFFGWGFGTYPELPLSSQACQITRNQYSSVQNANLYLLAIAPP